MTELAQLLDLAAVGGWQAGMVFFRVGAAMALLPAFGSQSVPVRVRLAIAFAFTAVVTPALAPDLPPPPEDPIHLAQVMLAEAASGLALGVSIRLFFWLLQVAGAMAAQATSLAQLLGAESVDPQPAIAQILLIAGLALAVMAGLHLRIAESLIMSYRVLPPGVFPLSGDLSEWGTTRIGNAFYSAFTLAAPFLIASLLYNLALGAINRAMPQLMVAFVGAPAITAGGLGLLLLVAPLALPLWLDALDLRLADPFGLPP